MTTRDALIRQAEAYHRIPARTDIEAEALPGWMAEGAFAPRDLDWDRLAADGPAWMQHWDERIKGRGAAYLAETE